MNKGDAISRIVQMRGLIDRDSTPEHEKAVAQEMIVRLKAQFSLDEQAIKRAIDIEEAGGVEARSPFGGGKIWFFEQRIKPHVDVIKEEINKALTKIAQQDTRDQVQMLAKLYDDLRGLNEAGAKNASFISPPVQELRNEAVRKLYTEELAKLGDDYSRQSKHEYAVMYTKSGNDLTTQQIEAIVGVHSDDHIWEDLEAELVAEAQEHGCTCTPKPYFRGKRTKKRVGEGLSRGTRYFPRELSHRMDCPLNPNYAYYQRQQLKKSTQ